MRQEKKGGGKNDGSCKYERVVQEKERRERGRGKEEGVS